MALLPDSPDLLRFMDKNLAVGALSTNPLATADTSAAGTAIHCALRPVYNQAATAAGTDLLINRTETAVGSGSQKLLDLQVGGTSKFSVDNSGNVTAAGTILNNAKVTSLTTGTSAPTAAQSGTTFVFNVAGGCTVTLPAPVVGLRYRYLVGTTFTGTMEIDTDAGTTFIGGNLQLVIAASATTLGCVANPASTVKIKADADTKGRLQGGWIELVCISSTVWHAYGILVGSGSIATPFA